MSAQGKLGKATATALLGVLVVLVVNAVAAHGNIRTVVADEAWVAHTHEVLAGLAELPAGLTEIENAGRERSRSTDAKAQEAYDAAVRALEDRLTPLEELTADNAAQQVRLRQVRSLLAGPAGGAGERLAE